MTPACIIERAAAEGVRLMLSPMGTVKARGCRSTVERWLPFIRTYKAEIANLLRGQELDARDLRDHFEERAGIREFDGGEVRAVAERHALLETIVRWLERTRPDVWNAWCDRSKSSDTLPHWLERTYPEAWQVWQALAAEFHITLH